MGVGTSKSPAVGLPANPRVIYAENKSRREKAVSGLSTMAIPGSVNLTDSLSDQSRAEVTYLLV